MSGSPASQLCTSIAKEITRHICLMLRRRTRYIPLRVKNHGSP
uniref:Uncharacterized protein n=1 Tax=Arundo donax TaxID=35708 RepID=A0A0A9F658_ARUDO